MNPGMNVGKCYYKLLKHLRRFIAKLNGEVGMSNFQAQSKYEEVS